MSSTEPLKISWTWEEWQKSRARRRAISQQIGPPIVRRLKSSSDKRLRAAFSGKRVP
jgi:hypothetical protein